MPGLVPDDDRDVPPPRRIRGRLCASHTPMRFIIAMVHAHHARPTIFRGRIKDVRSLTKLLPSTQCRTTSPLKSDSGDGAITPPSAMASRDRLSNSRRPAAIRAGRVLL